MSMSLSSNNHTMMDYLHADIHVKAPSNGENGGEGCYVKDCSDRMYMRACFFLTCILDATLAVILKQAARLLPLAFLPFPPSSWPPGSVQAAPLVFSL